MRKSTKALFIIALVLLAIPLFYTLVVNQFVAARLPALLPLTDYPLVGSYMPQLLFWVSVGFLILAVVGIIVILLFPSQSSAFHIEKDSGNMTIQKRALESYVLETVKEEPFIRDPSVSIKVKKETIDVLITGKMRKVFLLTDKQDQLASAIKHNLAMLVGPNMKIETNVRFKDYQKREPAGTSRVE